MNALNDANVQNKADSGQDRQANLGNAKSHDSHNINVTANGNTNKEVMTTNLAIQNKSPSFLPTQRHGSFFYVRNVGSHSYFSRDASCLK